MLALWGLPHSDELYAHEAKVAEATNEELTTGHERRARLVPPLMRIRSQGSDKLVKCATFSAHTAKARQVVPVRHPAAAQHWAKLYRRSRLLMFSVGISESNAP